MKVFGRLVLILVLVGGLTAGGFWLYKTQLAPQPVAAADGFTQVVAVRQGDLTASISVVGELYAVQKEDLSFDRMAGTAPLVTLEVEAGNTVQAGQLLATIGAASYQQALDQAQSALQEAEAQLADLQEPPTELDIAKADLAVAQANLDLKQAQQDLADLDTPDLTGLQSAVLDAQDNLALAQLQQTLANHTSMAKSERDLTYAAQWHERRVWELQDLVSKAAANQEQIDELAQEQKTLSEIRADLAQVQAQRQVSLEASDAEVATSQVALADAQAALADAQVGGDELDRAKAKLVVQQAEVTLKAAEDARTALDEGPNATDLAAARADVDKKRLAASEAELDLAATQMVAPFDGTVLQTHADPGDLITSSKTVLTVANLQQLEVLASVDETTIRQVAEGQAAESTFDAYPGQTFKGRILSVPLQGSLQGGVTVYQAPVSLEGAENLPLLVGMTANVEIQVGQVVDGLLAPTMALQNVGGMYQVMLPNSDPDGEPLSVPVEVGLSDGVYTQIVRGLNAGDQIVIQMASASSGQFRFPGIGMGMPGGDIPGGGRPSGR